MHQYSLRCGFSSFFKRLPHRLVGNRVDDLELHEPVRQKPQGPSDTPGWRIAARHRDQVRLARPIERSISGRLDLLLAMERRLHATQDETLTRFPHGVLVDLQRLGRLLVLPFRTVGVDLQ